MFLAEDGVQLRGAFWDGRREGALTLVLLHERGADRTLWDPYIAFFLSRGWSVLAFDLRGHGESVRQDVRGALQPTAPPAITLEAGWPLDVQAAFAFCARQPKADPGKLAVVGVGLGADLAYAAAARGWGCASAVCVSADETRARALAGSGAFAPRCVYLVYGGLDETGNATAISFASSAVFPAECMAYEGTARTGIDLWEERQPEIVARSIAWIERTA